MSSHTIKKSVNKKYITNKKGKNFYVFSKIFKERLVEIKLLKISLSP